MTEQVPELQIAAERIQAALSEEHFDQALEIFRALSPGDQAELFTQLEEEQQAEMIARLDVESTADLFDRLTDSETLEAAENLPIERLADILEEMQPDEAADLLGDLPPEQAAQALEEMEDLEDVLPLLGFPDETAGGRMTTEYIAMRRHTRADQAIKFLRDISPDHEVPYYIFVVDREKRLVGVLGLRELVIAPPDTIMEDIMDTEVVYVTSGTDQEEVAREMMRHDLSAIPVLDEQHHLLGVITHDDIIDVIQQEASEDILKLGGVETGAILDIPYWSQKISQVVRSRFSWLIILFVAETLTGTVLRHFEEELRTVVALSFFVPLLIGTGGNAGSQTVATIIRGMALGDVSRRDLPRVLWRELRTGFLLGLLVGVVGYGRALLWGVDWHMAVTVGITIAFICTWATSIAALVPILANRVGIDPTVVSGPLMATLIDATGLVIYFSLAALIIPGLR